MIFKRSMNEKETILYNSSISFIKFRTKELINEIDFLISNRDKINFPNSFNIKFFFDQMKNDEERIEYLKQLKEKLLLMNDCDKVRVKVGTFLHPMCWMYELGLILEETKNFKKIGTILKKFEMHGFCVPFKIGKPIMITYRVFKRGENELNQILSHELTHSLMNTKDIIATDYKRAINDAWTICMLYI